MAGTLLDRALGMLELLASEPAGLALQEIANRLDIPKSAAHRLLGELIRHGYVRQNGTAGSYMLTTKLLTLGYGWLGGSGIAELAQPVLDRLAASTGELVRYAVVDGDQLTWVAKAQGARFGLRLDPDQGMEAVLYCTATGHAWLAAQSDEEAMRLVTRQGFGRLQDDGPNAPRTVEALRNRLVLARERGYAWVFESSAPGTAAVAANIVHPVTRNVVGVLSIAGPSARLTEERMYAIAPDLLEAAATLSLGVPEAGAAALPRAAPQSPIGRGSLHLRRTEPALG
ncbi:MAG TPA: IclR family transcriptional regulator [Acetobacteraceae bacterium]